ncbi:hypothetical protein IV203_036522 [Nitzschia inconspicua]|uniref:Uncharacterized protein n=1 Tax=Nitzschia inconspicua TaxID=303405 RepID=A0A9K3PVL3_9STRA|nr:hypothetical protein IV203_036522 [Nitzschia inconspicua]
MSHSHFLNPCSHVDLLGTGTSITVDKYDKIATRIVSETSNSLMTSNLNVNGTDNKPAIRYVMSIDAIYDQVEILEKICSVHFSYIVDAFFNETDRFPIKSRILMLLDGIHPVDKWHLWLSFNSWALILPNSRPRSTATTRPILVLHSHYLFRQCRMCCNEFLQAILVRQLHSALCIVHNATAEEQRNVCL